MKRRDFIRASALATGLVMTPDFLKAGSRLLPEMSAGKKLVVIQLSGGNDGLNTVIPYKNDLYYKLRKKLALPEKEVLPLTDELALHPSLKFLQECFRSGDLTIVNNVGYPNPDRSHFRSTDIWHSASDASEFLSTGWLGRYLDQNGKTAHDIIETDSSLSLAVKGETRKAIALTDPKQFYLMTTEDLFASLSQDHENEQQQNLFYLYRTLTETAASAQYIQEKTKLHQVKAEYPATPLGKQLKSTSMFIGSGLETAVYYVAQTGYDTHVSQAGTHARLLGQLDEALQAFIKDLRSQNRWKDTLIMIFSEFGRRVAANASGGTDHGTAGNVLLLGGALRKKGILNEGPDLKNLDDGGDLKFRMDFRCIYAGILERWLGAESKKILYRDFEDPGFV
ncbi:MAG: DUF1501 domain-containing protein [Bacteroidia bacterium]|nr:DUF1501 domain-containing protein [Bacteroidia bacterium]